MTIPDAQGWVILIGAFFSGIISILTYLTNKKVDASNIKLDDAALNRASTNNKLDIIHTQTNSNLTDLQEKLDAAVKEIAALKEKIK